jgi:hypothetical protein
VPRGGFSWPVDTRSTQGASSTMGSLLGGSSLVQVAEALHIGQTGNSDWSDQSELRRLEVLHVIVFVFIVMFRCQTHFLVTPLGKIVSINQLNLSSSAMSTEIDSKNVIMVTLEEIPEQQCKAFEAHRQAAKKRRKVEEAQKLQEFLACFKKESVTEPPQK